MPLELDRSGDIDKVVSIESIEAWLSDLGHWQKFASTGGPTSSYVLYITVDRISPYFFECKCIRALYSHFQYIAQVVKLSKDKSNGSLQSISL